MKFNLKFSCLVLFFLFSFSLIAQRGQTGDKTFADRYVFTDLPISRIYVQYKSKEFFFEDKTFTVINFGERHTFSFFFDASKAGNFFRITEEEFFKP